MKLFPYHYLVGCRDFGNFSGAKFAIFDVGCSSGTDTTGFCWCVHTHKNYVCLSNCGVDIRREEQIPTGREEM